jgi:hypothetical protein
MTENLQVNIPLLRKAVEWAEAEAAKPFELSEWEQRYYVLTKADAEDYPDLSWGRLRASKAPECGTCYCIAGYVAATTTGDEEPLDPEWTAISALGLTEHQAEALFGASNTIEDVRCIAEEIAGERL